MSTPDNKISLTIISSSGDLTDDFPVNQKLSALKKSVMNQLGVNPSKAKQYQLVYDGDPLPGNKTLDDLDLPEEAELVLEPEPEVI